jgi:hypothetical protein
MAGRAVDGFGCDLSLGMLRAARGRRVVGADAAALPFPTGAFDVVVAAHMLYHVPDRETAIRELRRVLVRDGACVAVTNGGRDMVSLRSVVDKVVQDSTPGWTMGGWATELFSLENGPAQLEVAFNEVRFVRPLGTGRVIVRDARVVADYVASVADHYQGQVHCPWPEVVERVRREVQQVIDKDGAFVTSADVGALVCR